MRIRTLSELNAFSTLEERFRYLSLSGTVGEATFGNERWANQRFYHSREWRDLRDFVIARDEGMDLASVDVQIAGSIHVHHMNPITMADIENYTPYLHDPEYLISASHRTHMAVHYGDERQLPRPFVERTPNDHIGWRPLPDPAESRKEPYVFPDGSLFDE